MLGADELQPISWRVWAGKAERESRGGGPFQVLEERVGFVDIRVGSLCSSRAIEAMARPGENLRNYLLKPIANRNASCAGKEKGVCGLGERQRGGRTQINMSR